MVGTIGAKRHAASCLWSQSRLITRHGSNMYILGCGSTVAELSCPICFDRFLLPPIQSTDSSLTTIANLSASWEVQDGEQGREYKCYAGKDLAKPCSIEGPKEEPCFCEVF